MELKIRLISKTYLEERNRMTIEETKNLISTGEKIDVEFKKSSDDLNKDLYESVCSFNNRDGGHIFLGIEDRTKKILVLLPT